MEEGTGVSLYILVGIIIFGLFVSLATLFGTEIHAQSSNIIACVESYMSDDPTDCGESDPNDLGELITTNDIRIGVSGDEWMTISESERMDIVKGYLDQIENQHNGANATDWFNVVKKSSYSYKDYLGAVYGVYDDTGKLVQTYSYGITSDSGSPSGFKTIRVNDDRLVPDDVKQNSSIVNEADHYYYEYLTPDTRIYYRVYQE